MSKVIGEFAAERIYTYRYRVEYRSKYSGWTRDRHYRTYLAARFNVSIWNSVGNDARIVDTRSADENP